METSLDDQEKENASGFSQIFLISPSFGKDFHLLQEHRKL
jgi:hypothetical protein